MVCLFVWLVCFRTTVRGSMLLSPKFMLPLLLSFSCASSLNGPGTHPRHVVLRLLLLLCPPPPPPLLFPSPLCRHAALGHLRRSGFRRKSLFSALPRVVQFMLCWKVVGLFSTRGCVCARSKSHCDCQGHVGELVVVCCFPLPALCSDSLWCVVCPQHFFRGNFHLNDGDRWLSDAKAYGMHVGQVAQGLVVIDGQQEWYCQFCFETTMWSRAKCRRCKTDILAGLRGKRSQAVPTRNGRGWIGFVVLG